MTWTDKHGRPELIAQPFVYQGTARARVVEPAAASASEPAPELVETEPAGRQDVAEQPRATQPRSTRGEVER